MLSLALRILTAVFGPVLARAAQLVCPRPASTILPLATRTADDTHLIEVVVVPNAPAPASRPQLTIAIPSTASLPELVADDASDCSSSPSSPRTPDVDDRTFALAPKSALNAAAAPFVPSYKPRSDLDPSTPAFVPGARVLPAYVRQRAQLSFEEYIAELFPRIRVHLPGPTRLAEFPRPPGFYTSFPDSPSPSSRVHVGLNRHKNVYLRPACHGRYKRTLETLYE